jgi:virginiamycin A acetyltransferase
MKKIINFRSFIKNKIRNYVENIINDYFKRSHIYKSTINHPTRVGKGVSLNEVVLGSYSYLSKNCTVSHTVIGKFCSIGPNCMIGWGVHPLNGISTSPMFYSTRKQNGVTLSCIDKIEERKVISIGNDVFIGMNVVILDGVKIGDGAVIGAGAVVSKDIPPYAIAVGSPIKIIGYRFEPEIIEKLLTLKWWDGDDAVLRNVEELFFEVNNFIEKQSKTIS